MLQLPDKYSPILLEAIEEQMYKVSLQLDAFKGKSLTKERRQLTAKQKALEELQHLIHSASVNAT